jgi:hypothetical protein
MKVELVLRGKRMRLFLLLFQLAKNLGRDFIDRGAHEDPQASSGVPERLAQLATTILPLAAAFVNHFTPAFADLLDFRARLIVAPLVLLTVAWLCIRIITAKKISKGALIGSESLLYEHQWTDRLLGKFILPLIVLALGLSCYDLRFLDGRTLSLEVKVHSGSIPMCDVTVELLNLDKRPVNKNNGRTDDVRGLTVLELDASRGRVAYYSLKGHCDLLIRRLPHILETQIYGDKVDVDPISLPYDSCSPQQHKCASTIITPRDSLAH